MFLIRGPQEEEEEDKDRSRYSRTVRLTWSVRSSYLHTTSILITLIERIFSRISSGTWIDEWSQHQTTKTSKNRISLSRQQCDRRTATLRTYLTAKMADTLSMVSQSPTIGGWDADPFILCETCRVISPVIGPTWTNSCFIVAAGLLVASLWSLKLLAAD